MSDDEVVERRSMVGAPPSASRRGAASSARPSRAASSRLATKSAKRKREGESDDESDVEKHEVESEAGDNDVDDSGDDGDDASGTSGKPKKKRRRGFKPLTDSIARKKRTEAKKAAEREARLLSGYESPVEIKPPTPEPVEPEPVITIPSVQKYTPMQLMCDHLLRKVQCKDPDEYFAFPVTPSMAPEYHTIITHPMDFTTMRQKIEDDLYETINDMRVDAELIVSNALTFNSPTTVYHLAATRLSAITRYYFSEKYLRYIFHTLPFANKIPLEKAGLTPLAYVPTNFENKRRLAVVDKMTGDDCMKAADPAVRSRLSLRTPAKIAFMDNKDGATVMNVLGETAKINIRLIDIIGPLDEGNPGMIALGDHRLSTVSPMSYLTSYGPFCSFAPQYDSTWASLTKKDSDLLLRTYGDRSTASDVVSMRNMVADAGEHFIKLVDDMLDTLTDGEHTRAYQSLKMKPVAEKPSSDIADLLADIESLENIGIDVSFVEDVRQKMGIGKNMDIQSQLDASGHAVVDLARIQNERLSKPPPVTLTKANLPSALETQLASSLQQQLASQVSTHTQPSDVISAPTIHRAIGLQEEFDMELLGEFFVT